MEPALAYVVIVLSGITLTSTEAVPMDTCDELKQNFNTTVVACVEKETDCGKGTKVRCKGRAE